ncbi:MAG TPA: aminodeoxychorismate synthase component I [Alphaproteobacteria bacterium]|nr:aminodeoxychorismate synthase component I [Alphaproteobacteria bacterium]
MTIRAIPYRDPPAAFQPFAEDLVAAFPDNAAPSGGERRVSYIAADPFCVIEASARGATVDGRAVKGDPFAVLACEMRAYADFALADKPVPFAGGAAGYLGFELGDHLERLPPPPGDALGLPRMMIGFYDAVAAFDQDRHEAWVLHLDRPGAAEKAERLAQKIAAAPERLPAPARVSWQANTWQPELARAEVERRIAHIIDYIHAGDIFQANFTQRFRAVRPAGLGDWEIYRRLRALSPAPCAAFLRCGDGLSVASASPECFLRLDAEGHAESFPIKGTRPRDADPARDAALAYELKASAKDRAENLMIVDLMRNDLSRVCAPGSVKVPKLCALQSFASVHHLVSAVTGRMRAGLGAVDLLRAAFPGGSVSGAPKIRALEIIRELEPAPRGVYCGAIGWIGFDQAMEMSMAIRTLTLAGDTILAQAGGGIVADSDPAAEYEESMAKMEPLLQAVAGTRADEAAA